MNCRMSGMVALRPRSDRGREAGGEARRMVPSRVAFLAVVVLGGGFHTLPPTAEAQRPLPPDSVAILAITYMRSGNAREELNAALAALHRLHSAGHLAVESPLFRTVADSLVALAESTAESRARAHAFGLMQSFDPSGEAFPVPVWEGLIDKQDDSRRYLRLTLLGILAKHPDRAEAARAIARAAERYDHSHTDVDTAIEYLLDMGPHGIAALEALWRSGRITDPASRRRLERMSHTGFREEWRKTP
jgi:hypothetical protein